MALGGFTRVHMTTQRDFGPPITVPKVFGEKIFFLKKNFFRPEIFLSPRSPNTPKWDKVPFWAPPRGPPGLKYGLGWVHKGSYDYSEGF